MGKVLVLYLLLIGCGTPPHIDIKPEQDIVTKIIWNQSYGMTGPAPTIEWIEQPQLNCYHNQGFETEYTLNNVDIYGCVGGASYMDTWTTMIAWPTGSKYSDTAIAHEFAHFYEFIKTGYPDPDHLSQCYVPVTGCVAIVNQALKDAGL